MYQEQLDAYIEAHKEEMLEDLKELVKIPSMRGEALPGKPYGEMPAKAVEKAGELMKNYGFSVTNYDNYVVTGDFNDKEKGLDILAHLDVVPVTQDWTVTEPFTPLIKDGRIYGRGTSDDKGPAIAALYAMRALKETNVPLSKNVRLILGSDEECGSSDLEYYFSKEEEAPATFTPDADFPVINIEKGRLERDFTVSFSETAEDLAVLELSGGDKVNVVPAKAIARIKGIAKAEIEKAIAADTTGVNYTLEENGEEITIHAKGLAAHASTPELGKNALCALIALVGKLPLAQNSQTEALRAMAAMFPFGDTAGKALGIEMKDEISGPLTMNLGIFLLDQKGMKGVLDSRVPICGSDATVTNVIAAEMGKHGISMKTDPMTPPHHVPEESTLVQTLLASYEKYTGIKGKALAVGGGTYVHELKRGVAFGCMSDDVDNHMHGDDEFMVIDVIVMSAKIFADAIYQLCK